MKTISALLLLTLIASPSCAAEIRGVWTASPGDEVSLHFNISRQNDNHFGHSIALSSFTGLTDAQVESLSETPVHFRLEREAGSFAFEGMFKMREGAGHLVFTPNRRYLDSLSALGVAVDDLPENSEKLDDRLFTYALLDLSTAYIRSMQAEGYRESAKTYLSLRIFRVTPELVRELRVLGYDKVPARDLVKLQIHGAAPDYIRELAAAGYRNLPLEDLIRFRIHGVTTASIREYRALGYDKLTPEELVKMRIHGVTPQYIREMKAAGYSNVPVEKLVSMRIFGIDARYAKGMTEN